MDTRCSCQSSIRCYVVSYVTWVTTGLAYSTEGFFASVTSVHRFLPPRPLCPPTHGKKTEF